MSLEKLGNVHSTQGDLAAARASYEASREIRTNLAAADPSNAQWQRDVALSYNKLGMLSARIGDTAEARREFTAGLVIAQSLEQWDPTNAAWHHDAALLRRQIDGLPRET